MKIPHAIQHDIEESLFSRLSYIQAKPENILIVGDISDANILKIQNRHSFETPALSPRRRGSRLLKALKSITSKKQKSIQQYQGSVENMPFEKDEFDAIFMPNFMHQSKDLDLLYGNISKILAPGGLLLFSTFGPDTKSETYDFADMHDVGDALLKAGFKDPVMDAERITQDNQMFEVVYGHGWGGEPKRQQVQTDGSVKISVQDLFKSER